MDLRVDRRCELPIHVQLKTQLSHMIQTGQLAPGARLPTVRQLAGFLRINRNTAARVFTDLERDGYVTCDQGRGTFVARRAAGRGCQPRMTTLMRLVDAALVEAARSGFGAEEFAAALYTRAHAAPVPPPPKLKGLFTECNRPQLEEFAREVEETLPITVDRMLVRELEQAYRRSPSFLKRYALVITTFWHVHEVQTLLKNEPIDVVGLVAEASLETLMRLTALPEGTKVGVACHDMSGAENAKLSIQNAGLTNIRPVTACGVEPESLRRMLKEAQVVVCSSLVAKKVRTLAPKGTEILVDDRTLNKGGLEMLRERLAAHAAALQGAPAARGAR